jgi:hypothetical protein
LLSRFDAAGMPHTGLYCSLGGMSVPAKETQAWM